jgi:hypothetical protein
VLRCAYYVTNECAVQARSNDASPLLNGRPIAATDWRVTCVTGFELRSRRFKLAAEKGRRLRCRQCRGFAFQTTPRYYAGSPPDNVVVLKGRTPHPK